MSRKVLNASLQYENEGETKDREVDSSGHLTIPPGTPPSPDVREVDPFGHLTMPPGTYPESTEPSCRCYPHCCGQPVFRGNQEALAWDFDVTGRTISIISIGAFLMPALLELAFHAAGCPDTSVECDKTVYGIRPSSLLTTVHTIVTVCAAPLMPLYGAIVDYTSHRRLIGRCVSVGFLALLFPQIFVSETTWFAMVILQILLFFIFLFQMVAAYSYLPELTDNEQVLNEFTRNFTVTAFCAVVVYIAAIVGVSVGLDIQSDNVLVARIAVATSFCVAAITLFLAWGKLFQERPPLHELPPDRSVWSAGFRKLYHSCIKIWKDYRALKWFYIAIAFCDGAIQSLMTIMITFFIDQLGFESADIGVAVLVMLLANIPAGCIASRFTRHFNPVRSSMAATFELLIVTAIAAAVLKEPGQEMQAYIIVFFWGIGTGWKWTSDRMLSVAIIPEGQSAEFMGIYLFWGQILTWLPPLVFTALNEAGVSQRIALGTQDVYFLIGFAAYCFMGNYRTAVDAAQGAFSRGASSEATEQPNHETAQ